MRKIVVALLAVSAFLTTISLSAAVPRYAPGQTAEAYAYTHGGYVGQAIVKVQSNGSLDVEIDEAFLPHILAVVNLKSSEWSEDNTVFYVSHGRKAYVAKYVEYDGVVYVGTTVGTALIYVMADDSGQPSGSDGLEKLIIKNQDTMAAYYKNIKNGGFKVMTGFKSMAEPVTATNYGGVTKASSPKYWNFGQTWQGNINAIEKFIEENGATYSFSEMAQATEKNSDGLKLWSVADAMTGATNSDFKDYFGLAQLAIAQLKMK